MSASLVHTTLWSPASSIPLGNVEVLLIVLNNGSSITDKSFVHVFWRWRLKSSDHSNEAVSGVYEGAGDWGVNSGGSLVVLQRVEAFDEHLWHADDNFKNVHECIYPFAPSTLKDKDTISDNIALYLERLNISILLSWSVMGQPMMSRSEPPGVVAIYL